MNDPTKNSVKKVALSFTRIAFAVALALLLILVLRSIAVQITPPPAFSNEPYPDVSSEELCDTAGGRWVESSVKVSKSADRPAAAPLSDTASYCQGPLAFERQQTIQAEASQQTSLFVFAIGGALAIAISLLISQLKPVAPGLLLGGIFSFFVAGVHVWTLAPGIGRLVTIVVIFVILVLVGLHVFRDKEN